ncbi:rod shape-determining protein MreC [Reinekea sp. G2M2-21]|uniref:rod shape-determining protein MreC n=1 Tax=Reinekea sp. G2M2-21 TaxID=2788942 RepID=UPI0018AC6866|nr:rod shape-determining protein MreC [Reinekea sp.]
MKALFTAGPQHGYRFAVAISVSLLLMFLDTRFVQVDRLRQSISYIVSPVQSLVSLPSDIVSWSTETFAERNELLDSNRTLRSQMIILQQKVQQLAVLEAENDRLRRLLDATARLDSTFITAEMVSVDPDPFSIQVIVNRGANDGVYIGQAVVDADGLFGLVVQVDSLTSRVALVADVNLAVPVYVNRNGMRSVVVGTGDLKGLEMEYVPDTADIQIGDMLVTSGLGNRFPAGYPVAEVVAIEHDPGEPFARIRARPLAQLDRSRSLLMVFQQESK